ADQYRADLATAGIGDGQYGWSYALPESLRDRQTHTIVARIANSGYELGSSPRQVQCAPWRAASFVRQEVATEMVTGQQYNVSVTLRNSGSGVW
ncbi:hypothetical protein Q0N68_13670, partial [Staphylococcus aureus]|nr:hypothetical protein [Staphylococcus aureus]